jgi:hypothetical protein
LSVGATPPRVLAPVAYVGNVLIALLCAVIAHYISDTKDYNGVFGRLVLAAIAASWTAPVWLPLTLAHTGLLHLIAWNVNVRSWWQDRILSIGVATIVIAMAPHYWYGVLIYGATALVPSVPLIRARS